MSTYVDRPCGCSHETRPGDIPSRISIGDYEDVHRANSVIACIASVLCVGLPVYSVAHTVVVLCFTSRTNIEVSGYPYPGTVVGELRGKTPRRYTTYDTRSVRSNE